MRGIFLHSAEGYAGGLWANLNNINPPLKNRVSWHLTNLFTGELYQHYPLTARCWHATAANDDYVGMEHEGKVPEFPSLTEAQIVTSTRVIQELADHYGWAPRRAPGLTQTLWEHREVTRLGGTATACPSGRIPWDEIMRRLRPAPAPKMEEAMIVAWASCNPADLPVEGVPFRSYVLFATPTGLASYYVPTAEEHKALLAAGRTLMTMNLAELRAYHCVPAPDAP